MGRGRGATEGGATELGVRPRRSTGAGGPRLDPGFQASNEELFDFTCGQCHALAWALHEETGWQLAACGWDGEGIPEHVFVIHPDGSCVDIHGRSRRGAHPDSLPTDWRRVDRSFVEELAGENFDVMDLDRAGFTARMMLGRDPWD